MTDMKPLELTRVHIRRLRHYWQTKAVPNAGVSLADGVDLDLAAHGFIERRHAMGITCFVITSDGEKQLHEAKAREISNRAPHHHLAQRMAQHLQNKGRITWENIELSAELACGTKRLIRPDVFSLAATYNEKKLAPCVHEIKVSRADFLNDVAKAEKRAGYFSVAESVVYVAPVGLISPVEVPEGCGLVVEYSLGEFEQIKRAKKRAVQISASTFMKLVLKPGRVQPL